jgi:hypothetical protein
MEYDVVWDGTAQLVSERDFDRIFDAAEAQEQRLRYARRN